MNVGAVSLNMNPQSINSSVSSSSIVSNYQINSLEDKSNMFKLGVAMLMLHEDKDEDSKTKKLASAILLASMLEPRNVCNFYNSVSTSISSVTGCVTGVTSSEGVSTGSGGTNIMV